MEWRARETGGSGHDPQVFRLCNFGNDHHPAVEA
jgi:hypothetical protein